MSRQDNRSDAALRKRLKIAGKATPGSWSLQDKGAIPLVYGPNGERIAKAIDNLEDTAHIAASSPDVVREDIEELLRLRQEVARLNKEADWLAGRLNAVGSPCPDGSAKGDCGCKGWPCTPCFREAARKAVERNG